MEQPKAIAINSAALGLKEVIELMLMLGEPVRSRVYSLTRTPARGENVGVMTTETPERCPCGKGDSLKECCGPLLAGERGATTAEELMRSRYSAFATGEVGYILKTHDPETVDEVDKRSTERWSRESDWLGLEIVGTEKGEEGDSEGTVDFIAKYQTGDRLMIHRERASFRKHNQRWVFVNGKTLPKPKKQLIKGFVPSGKKHKNKKK